MKREGIHPNSILLTTFVLLSIYFLLDLSIVLKSIVIDKSILSEFEMSTFYLYFETDKQQYKLANVLSIFSIIVAVLNFYSLMEKVYRHHKQKSRAGEPNDAGTD